MACGVCRRPWIVWYDRDHFTVSRGCMCHCLVGRVPRPIVVHPPTPTREEIEAYADGIYGAAFN